MPAPPELALENTVRMLQGLDVGSRARAAGLHLLISALVAAVAAGLVFGLWYPGPYRLLSGGRSLFLLVVSVDVVLGPLLTFAVFNLAKGWRQLRIDLAVIALIQTAGLIYGMHTVFVVRPIAMVFEVDQFRVITAADVHLPELPEARPEYRSLPLTGPWLLGVRASKGSDERNKALFMALEGVDVGQRPTFWQPYFESRAAAVTRSRPLDILLRKYPQHGPMIQDKLRELSLDASTARFLPVVARGDWIALLDAAGNLSGFLPLDGYF